jgi:hypothetical protein
MNRNPRRLPFDPGSLRDVDSTISNDQAPRTELISGPQRLTGDPQAAGSNAVTTPDAEAHVGGARS